jgi:transcriptional regulator with XRE-family HTH domain
VSDPIVAALKAERKRQGLSLERLGKRMGRHTYQTVWQWESGTHAPTLASLRAWADALGFDLVLAKRPEVS